MPASSSSYRSDSGSLTAGQMRMARALFYSGWVITLLYFPSGLMHAVLGKGVYARDILLFLHLCAGIRWMIKTRKLQVWGGRSWLLLVPAIFVLPAIFNDVYRVEALTFVKWTAFWLDWVLIGRLTQLLAIDLNRTVLSFLLVTGLLLYADLGAGVYERSTGSFVLQQKNEVSAFGVGMDKEDKLAGRLRVKGLQRDVFSYANLMGMSCVAGLLAFATCESLVMRSCSLAWSLSFAIALFVSGGRSAFLGVLGAGMVVGGLMFAPDKVRKNYTWIVLAWFLIGLTISAVGVGRLTEAVGGSVLHGSQIGDSDSAYERDANWTGITNAIESNPVVLVAGAPMASLLDPKIDAIYHWADNQYLWLIYHASLVGLFAMCMYFAHMLRSVPAGGKIWLRDALILYLLFVMGEAIARESLTFIGCMPLFVACGCQMDAREEEPAFNPTTGSKRPRQPVKMRSDADEFTRRIREAARRNA